MAYLEQTPAYTS